MNETRRARARNGLLTRVGRPATVCNVDESPLIACEALTATLFAISDIREDVGVIRRWLTEEDDGETQEDDS